MAALASECSRGEPVRASPAIARDPAEQHRKQATNGGGSAAIRRGRARWGRKCASDKARLRQKSNSPAPQPRRKRRGRHPKREPGVRRRANTTMRRRRASPHRRSSPRRAKRGVRRREARQHWSLKLRRLIQAELARRAELRTEYCQQYRRLRDRACTGRARPSFKFLWIKTAEFRMPLMSRRVRAIILRGPQCALRGSGSSVRRSVVDIHNQACGYCDLISCRAKPRSAPPQSGVSLRGKSLRLSAGHLKTRKRIAARSTSYRGIFDRPVDVPFLRVRG